MNQPTRWSGFISAKSYLLSYLLSLALTLFAYFLVCGRYLEGQVLAVALLGLAVLQAWAQLSCNFKLGKEEKPRWNLIAFYFMLAILLIITIGSLLIMHSLNYRMEG